MKETLSIFIVENTSTGEVEQIQHSHNLEDSEYAYKNCTKTTDKKSRRITLVNVRFTENGQEATVKSKIIPIYKSNK